MGQRSLHDVNIWDVSLLFVEVGWEVVQLNVGLCLQVQVVHPIGGIAIPLLRVCTCGDSCQCIACGCSMYDTTCMWTVCGLQRIAWLARCARTRRIRLRGVLSLRQDKYLKKGTRGSDGCSSVRTTCSVWTQLISVMYRCTRCITRRPCFNRVVKHPANASCDPLQEQPISRLRRLHTMR